MENLHNFQQMQDEMSRFEAEISGGNVAGLMHPVMAAGSFGTMQQSMDAGAMSQYPHAGLTAMMFHSIPLPPLPPHMMMVPQQVQQLSAPIYPVHLGPPSYHEFQQMQLQYHSMAGSHLMFPQPTPPPAPQPMVLSAKPQLYKKTKEMLKKEKHEKKQKRKAQQKALQEAALATDSTLMPPPPPPAQVVGKTKKERKNRKVVRTAGGQVWEDASLLEWAVDDYRMFCGDLGNDVTDELLVHTFSKYASFQRAKVVRDRRTKKSKGFGFICFKESEDLAKAIKEMDGRYVGSRPIKLRKSTWKHHSLDVVKEKEKEKQDLISVRITSKKN